ncbi:MAG: hypothetical protein JXA93_08530 [Anaerolineae bacterium]|nr:hypothetical protein [Anaerolineae bacterium]
MTRSKNFSRWLWVVVLVIMGTLSDGPVCAGDVARGNQGFAGPGWEVTAVRSTAALWPEGARVQATVHVATTGTDDPDCGSAAAPCRTLQYAVNLAQSGDTILVAAGTYTYSAPPPDSLCNLFSAAAEPIVCVVSKHLSLIGGYRASDWSGPNPQAYPTIIDGEQSHRGITVISSNPTTPASSLRLEGFTIQNGLAQGATQGTADALSGYGGGLYTVNAPVTVRDTLFLNNRAVGGDADYTFGGTGSGGGIALHGVPAGSVCVLERVTFEGNQAVGGTGRDRGGLAVGGGLSVDVAAVEGRSVTFTNNVAQAGSSNGSGKDTVYHYTADALGGAIGLRMYIDATFTNFIATGNRAMGGSAGVQAGAGLGGAVYIEFSALRVVDARLVGNEAVGGSSPSAWFGGGGAIGGFAYDLVMERSYVLENVARGGNGTTGWTGGAAGGGLYLVKGSEQARSLTLVNSVLARNEVIEGTGTNVMGGGGAGVWLEGVEGHISHTTFVDNRLGPTLLYGPALLLQQYQSQQPVRTDLHYSIVADHTGQWPAVMVQVGNVLNLSECLFAGNSDNVWGEGSVEGECTTAESAGFVGDEDYHLLVSSPAVGLSISSQEPFDIDRQARPYGSGRDAGADEYWPSESSARVYLPLVVR